MADGGGNAEFSRLGNEGRKVVCGREILELIDHNTVLTPLILRPVSDGMQEFTNQNRADEFFNIRGKVCRESHQEDDGLLEHPGKVNRGFVLADDMSDVRMTQWCPDSGEGGLDLFLLIPFSLGAEVIAPKIRRIRIVFDVAD
jgi:hypothetical protein